MGPLAKEAGSEMSTNPSPPCTQELADLQAALQTDARSKHALVNSTFTGQMSPNINAMTKFYVVNNQELNMIKSVIPHSRRV